MHHLRYLVVQIRIKTPNLTKLNGKNIVYHLSVSVPQLEMGTVRQTQYLCFQ